MRAAWSVESGCGIVGRAWRNKGLESLSGMAASLRALGTVALIHMRRGGRPEGRARAGRRMNEHAACKRTLRVPAGRIRANATTPGWRSMGVHGEVRGTATRTVYLLAGRRLERDSAECPAVQAARPVAKPVEVVEDRLLLTSKADAPFVENTQILGIWRIARQREICLGAQFAAWRVARGSIRGGLAPRVRMGAGRALVVVSTWRLGGPTAAARGLRRGLISRPLRGLAAGVR
jgi:hypothetical protein